MRLFFLLIVYSFIAHAGSINYKDNFDIYSDCPKFNSHEINIGSSEQGSFEYDTYNGYFVSKHEKHNKFFAHSNLVKYDSSNYVIWNVIPVGIGFLASQNLDSWLLRNGSLTMLTQILIK